MRPPCPEIVDGGIRSAVDEADGLARAFPPLRARALWSSREALANTKATAMVTKTASLHGGTLAHRAGVRQEEANRRQRPAGPGAID